VWREPPPSDHFPADIMETSMKKTLMTALLAAALVASVVGFAGTAAAHPTKTKACSSCHGSSSAVTITVKKKSSTAKKVTYTVKVSGGSGSTGWGVLAGGKNLAHKSSTSGTFSIAKGKKVKVWAVKTGSGAKAKTITAK
jgi:hypothetical protein